jgi:hypothetical protein
MKIVRGRNYSTHKPPILGINGMMSDAPFLTGPAISRITESTARLNVAYNDGSITGVEDGIGGVVDIA